MPKPNPSVEMLLGLIGDAYGNALKLLGALRHCAISDFPRIEIPDRPMFSLPEQVVHLIQVTEFTVHTVLDQLGIEEHPLHPMLHGVAGMPPSPEKHATLSMMNLGGPSRVLTDIEEMETLWARLEHTIGWMFEKLDLLGADDWNREIEHPLGVELKGPCLWFLHRMLVDHANHHVGEMAVLAKLAGHTDAIPSVIGNIKGEDS